MFAPRDVTSVEQGKRRKRKGLLRAAGDDHLTRITVDAARGAEVGRDGLA